MKRDKGRSLSFAAAVMAVVLPLALAAAGAVSATFLLTACANPLSALSAEKASKLGGSLTVSIDCATARTLLPPIDMNPALYAVSGSNSNGSRFEQSTAEATLTVGSLAFGTWTVTVEALNDEGTLIGRGQNSVNVNAGQTANLAVLVVPIAGSGTLALSLQWDAGKTQSPSISARLTPSSGAGIDLAFTVQSPGVATCTRTNLAAGYYTLELRLLDNGILAMGAVEVVRIVTGQTTSGEFRFTEINSPAAAIAVNITPALSDPISVTLSGQLAELAPGGSMTVSASVPAGTGNVVCAWYLNGQAKATGASYTLGAALAAGVYRLDVSVFSADGSRAGSATHSFRVKAPAVTQATLIWDPNSEPNLAGYKLHYGLASGSYQTVVDVGNRTEYTLTGLAAGETYYIAATAYNTAGAESGYSNEVVFPGSS